jgi:nucleoside-diphosphate-sugar epimerase
MGEKSKILFIGGTGYIGKHIVEASAKAGHPTFALVRESTLTDPAKADLLNKFKTLGVNLVPVSNILVLIIMILISDHTHHVYSILMEINCRGIFMIMKTW